MRGREAKERWPGLHQYNIGADFLPTLIAELNEIGDGDAALAILERDLGVVDSRHFYEPEWVLPGKQVEAVTEALRRLSKDHARECDDIMERAEKGRFVFVKPPPADD